MTTPEYKRTYKRELALVVFLWVVYLSIFGTESLGIVVYPAFAYIGLAMGLDWWGKAGSTKGRGEGEGR